MKIHCLNPNHYDQTPSMEVYEKWLHCFTCGYRVRNEDYEVKEKPKEDIEKTIRAIKTLPKVLIRELEFYADGNAYYIIWPDGEYYKKRLYSGRVRYLGPVGHQAPLFIVEKQQGPFIIVEGEINALSLKSAIPEFKGTIASPGSASEFIKHLDYILTIPCINAIVFVDRDAAGVAAGVELKRELLKRGKRVTLVALKEDFNDLLVKYGPEKVREVFRQETGLEV